MSNSIKIKKCARIAGERCRGRRYKSGFGEGMFSSKKRYVAE
jgi:hypothetical protein